MLKYLGHAEAGTGVRKRGGARQVGGKLIRKGDDAELGAVNMPLHETSINSYTVAASRLKRLCLHNA